MQNIKAIIFDLGRVLVRIDPMRDKFERLMRTMGIPPEEAFEKYWYASEVRRHMTGEIGSREFFSLATERFDLPCSFEEFAEGWCDLFEPEPGMAEIFNSVAQRYSIGLLSDTDPLHWEAIGKMLPWLDKAVPTLSFEVGFLKPHPRMFAAAAANCGYEPCECLFIDDMVENVDGARFNGMPALVFRGAAKLRRDLRGLGLM